MGWPGFEFRNHNYRGGCHKQRCKFAQKLAGLGGRKRKFVLFSSAKRIFFFSRRLLGEIFLCSANLGEAKIGEIFAEVRLVFSPRFAEFRLFFFRLDSPIFFRRDSPSFLAEIRLDSLSFFRLEKSKESKKNFLT